ncbi:MAG: MBL fold metallo-hydrolase [Zavarzinella sp.]
MMNVENPPSRGVPAVTFWGAAQVVTGSMHVFEYGESKILLDCGLFQGKREEARERNSRFPFSPRRINAVLVSHAHIDHCGNLPTLIRQGYNGPIYCTPAGRDLLAVMLIDSAKIQEEEAAHLNIQRQYAEPFVEPLYARIDVDQVLAQCVPLRYHEEHQLNDGISFHFAEAGHVLGSSMIHITAQGAHGTKKITFTGDLGRRGLPLLRPSAPIPPADVLVCESTYGDRVHESIDITVEKMYATINKTIEREGNILIPAFSLGRTQLIIHYLQQGIIQKKFPKIPVYVDSPLAANITEVYENHPECLTDDAQKLLRDGTGILGGDCVTYIRDFEDSLRISRTPGSKIIVASSGMCDAGRILHHLKEHVDDPRSTVMLVSYQAPGTTGRRLLDKNPTVRFLGKEWNKWIDVVHLEGFSAHADKEDFLSYMRPLVGKIGKIRLIHGEKDQANAMATHLMNLGFEDVSIPQAGEQVLLQ